MTTNVPKPTFGPKGFSAPLERDILAGAQEDMSSAFGGGLNPSLKTPQGQLATTVTALLGYVNDTFTHFTNQVDPAFSEGRMQDAIARIYFLERIAAQPTLVQGLCGGLTGTTIPEGSLASDALGNIYASLADATINATGFVTVDFANVNTGPTSCLAGAMNQIYKGVVGWDTVTNPVDGVLGRLEEKRAAFEDRRYLSVANNSSGMLASIRGAVLKLPGVLDCYVAENVESSTIVRQNVYLVPNSIYVAVLGGVASDIANAIFSKKMPGCAYTGDTAVQITMTEGYSPPYPTYSVAFQTVKKLQVAVAVTILSSPLVPSDAQELVRQAVIDAMNGDDDLPRPKIAAELLASRLFPAIMKLGTWAQIIRVKIGAPTAPAAKFMASLSGGLLNVSAMISGTIDVGQFVFDDAGILPAGTKIVAQNSGDAGGIGLYQTGETTGLSFPSSVVRTVVANSDSVLPDLNQASTTSAALVSLALATQ